MIACPTCSSSRTVVHVDSTRHARCLACGASWIQEGSWQRSIKRNGHARGPVAVATIAAPNGVSGLDLALAVVDELQRGHGAHVLNYDVVNGVPEITARVPTGSAPPQMESTIQRVHKLRVALVDGRAALHARKAVHDDRMAMVRAEIGRLAANRARAELVQAR